jgi:hypothetical protein
MFLQVPAMVTPRLKFVKARRRYLQPFEGMISTRHPVHLSSLKNESNTSKV